MAGRFANTQIMADPRIQQEPQLIQGPLPEPEFNQKDFDAFIQPTKNVMPINVDLMSLPKDDTFNRRVIEAYQKKMLGPSGKVSNKELVMLRKMMIRKPLSLKPKVIL